MTSSLSRKLPHNHTPVPHNHTPVPHNHTPVPHYPQSAYLNMSRDSTENGVPLQTIWHRLLVPYPNNQQQYLFTPTEFLEQANLITAVRKSENLRGRGRGRGGGNFRGG
ncbi:hypothetical protein BGX27_003903, partial [Mortierella sp. AM989]